MGRVCVFNACGEHSRIVSFGQILIIKSTHVRQIWNCSNSHNIWPHSVIFEKTHLMMIRFPSCITLIYSDCGIPCTTWDDWISWRIEWRRSCRYLTFRCACIREKRWNYWRLRVGWYVSCDAAICYWKNCNRYYVYSTSLIIVGISIFNSKPTIHQRHSPTTERSGKLFFIFFHSPNCQRKHYGNFIPKMLNQKWFLFFVVFIAPNLAQLSDISLPSLSNSNKSRLPPCKICSELTRSFQEVRLSLFGWFILMDKWITNQFTFRFVHIQGMIKTGRGSHGEGDADWTKQRMKDFKISEVRLVEIQDSYLCKDVYRAEDQCHELVEELETTIEEWWFNYQDEHPDLHNWLCVERTKVCCPPNHFGANCSPCTDCNGNGVCKGNGTRKGNGKCLCDKGYSGETCRECSLQYYESFRDESKLLCSPCSDACKKDAGCTGAGPRGVFLLQYFPFSKYAQKQRVLNIVFLQVVVYAKMAGSWIRRTAAASMWTSVHQRNINARRINFVSTREDRINAWNATNRVVDVPETAQIYAINVLKVMRYAKDFAEVSFRLSAIAIKLLICAHCSSHVQIQRTKVAKNIPIIRATWHTWVYA